MSVEMYSRFTDRSRVVMRQANQEAQRFSKEYIGTEDVLSGLLRETTGFPYDFLSKREVTLGKVREEVEKMVGIRPGTVTSGKILHTQRTKNLLEYSMEESRSLNHNYVGSEHLLLGLTRESEGGAQILMDFGLNLETMRTEIRDFFIGSDKRELEQRVAELAREKGYHLEGNEIYASRNDSEVIGTIQDDIVVIPYELQSMKGVEDRMTLADNLRRGDINYKEVVSPDAKPKVKDLAIQQSLKLLDLAQRLNHMQAE